MTDREFIEGMRGYAGTGDIVCIQIESRNRLCALAEMGIDLEKYGGHRNDPHVFCEKLKHSKYDCTCGWDDLAKIKANGGG